jgi:hypothetical protein
VTVQDYINTFALEHDNPYPDEVILKWINLVDGKPSIKKDYRIQYYSKTLNAFQFSLPTGVDFEHVAKLYVDGNPYKKKDTRAYKESRSFWYEDSTLCIYPACYETDLSYVSGVGEITVATNTITTTGDDFTFSIGDVVNITGCTNTANNKSAVIISKAAKVLTFSSGTFTAETVAGAVTISKCKIKLTYEYKPVTKLIANIATDTLNLPDEWVEIYDFFNLSKIAYNAKDYADAQNHMAMHDAKIAEYNEWWENHRAQSPETDIVAAEDIAYSSSRDFDTEV